MRKRKLIEDFRKELLTAIEDDDFYSVKKSIKLAEHMGLKKDALDNIEFGILPVHLAIEKDRMAILEFLLTKGANVDAGYGQYLSTPLHIAARDDKVEVVELLLKYKAYINAKDTQRQTPLHLASSHRKLDMVEFLLANKAIVNIQDWKNKIALNVVGDEVTCRSDIRKEISLMLKRASKVKVSKIGVMESSAVTPSSFINSMFSYVGASTNAILDSLFRSAPALPPTQQFVAHSVVSPIDSSQVDFNGTALLTAVTISKLTGKQCLRTLDNSPLTTEKIRERELNTMAKNVEVALDKCKKLYQCPENLLSNLTISKGIMHQMSF